jgi:hypothetical protein
MIRGHVLPVPQAFISIPVRAELMCLEPVRPRRAKQLRSTSGTRH